MADYTSRLAELQKAVMEAQAKDAELERRGGPPVVLARYAGLTAEVAAYIDWRDRALADGLQILKGESSSYTGKDQFGRWREHFTNKGAEAFKRFTDYVKNDQEPNLRRLGEDIASQESHFFAQLARSPLALVQGSMQEYRAVFEQERRNLADKWRAQHEGGKSIAERAKEFSKELMALFKKVSEEMIQANREMEGLFRISVSQYKESDNIDSFGSYVPQVAGIFNQRMASYAPSREALLRRYEEAYKAEETFVILVAQTREAVRNFLAKMNLTIARQEYEEACRSSKELAGQCVTAGQREDIQRFLDVATAEVKKFLDQFEQAYNQFVYEFRDVFVGPVGPKVIDELIEPSYWERFRDDLQRTDVEAELRKLYDDAVRCWGIDLSSLKEPQLKDLQNVWKVELERLTRGLHEVAGDTFHDRVEAVINEWWLGLVSVFKRSKGGGES